MRLCLIFMVLFCLTCAQKTRRTKVKKNTSELSCDCGRRNSGRLYAGSGTQKNEYPWMVYINSHCGGSIISPWHILTAAHCVYGHMMSDIIVTVGRDTLAPVYYSYIFPSLWKANKNAVIHTIAAVDLNLNFQHDAKHFDIAILVTKEKIQFNKYVSPVCLPSKRLPLDGKKVKLLGWGVTRKYGFNSVLREADQKVISKDECRRSWTLEDINDTQICTKSTDLGGPAHGDAGGPVVYLDPETNRFTQVGLIAAADPDFKKPAVNIDVFTFIDFIKLGVSVTRPGTNICTKVTN